MPLQSNLEGSGEAEPESNNTRPSPSSQLNVPYQHSDVSGTTYGAPPPQYQPAGPHGDHYQPPHAHFRMSGQHSAQLPPPPPPHPDFWYSQGSVADSSWKLISSPLVTKKAQSSRKDGEVASNIGMQQTGNSQELPESPSDISPLRFHYDSAGPPITTDSSLRTAPFYPPPYHDQGPYPPFYSMPPPPDYASNTQYPYQWQHPPHPYPTYPPPGYQVGPYPPYPVPRYANKPHMQYPAVPGHKHFGVAHNTKKRPLPASNNNTTVHAGYVPPRQQSHTSTRRKRKMYSDFVGVTYNLTHAKYQSCITHYRKQHYLGRYKLAVDAALAYDESARLLKGPSWKVNFPTREAYEKARKEEMQHVGRIGNKVTDMDQSKAAQIVASKISQLAADLSSQSKGTAVKPAGPTGSSNARKQSGKACDGSSKEKDGLVVRFKRPLDGTSMKKSCGKKATPFATTDDVEGMSKVTPSQLELAGMPPTSPEVDSKLQSSQSKPNEDENCDEAKVVEKTPLPSSPDPTRHTQGAEHSTPESVIKPKVLQYKGDVMKQNATESSDSEGMNKSTSNIETKMPVGTPSVRDASNMSTEKAPPVMKSGALVAASALMTLLGKEED